ncbi:MAG: bifunctional 4-hydroxy-2-oxoglutarate aldolase/2-dehydro-3-deoxy-phosphogluconate aldolase [Actinomycetota bacterium]|nr:bifunctional 4-hydroxy-2-oxoglutarate aldolase/2-dehydro-3-deoxy-phosphogluconate aldolase [Actinomycetota bacterium]
MDFDQAIRRHRAVVVLRAARYSDPRRVVETLVEAGLPVVEFTLTGENALVSVEQATRVPGALVGAGSVLNTSAARRCVDAGAAFLVSPVAAVEVAAMKPGIAVVLAGFTPTEILTAWNATRHAVKLFPASTGGPDHLRAIAAPLPEVPLMPSGGVGPGNVGDYLAAGAVAINVGSAVAPSQTLEAGDTDDLRRRARNLRAVLDDSSPQST